VEIWRWEDKASIFRSSTLIAAIVGNQPDAVMFSENGLKFGLVEQWM
jgi:hypothetical protein